MEINAKLCRKIERNKYYEQAENTIGLTGFQRVLEKLEIASLEYYNYLFELDVNGQIVKCWSNTNLRKKIEQLNSIWLIEATVLEEKHEALIKEIQSKKRASLTQSTNAPGSPAVTPSRGSTITKEDTVPIDDEETKKLWISTFGTKFQVEWDQFLKMVATYLKVTFNDDEKKAFKHILGTE